jgi:hypothetical protein
MYCVYYTPVFYTGDDFPDLIAKFQISAIPLPKSQDNSHSIDGS